MRVPRRFGSRAPGSSTASTRRLQPSSRQAVGEAAAPGRLDVHAEFLEETVEADADPPEAVEKEEQSERHEERAADEPHCAVTVAQPARGAHCLVEADPDEKEGDGQAE